MGPRASDLLDMGGTDGPRRYKTEDSHPCPDGTLLCVDGKLAFGYVDSFLCKPTLYNPRPLRCLYKREGLVRRGNHNHNHTD